MHRMNKTKHINVPTVEHSNPSRKKAPDGNTFILAREPIHPLHYLPGFQRDMQASLEVLNLRCTQTQKMSYSSIIHGSTWRAAVNTVLTMCQGRCTAMGEENLVRITLITTHTESFPLCRLR